MTKFTSFSQLSAITTSIKTTNVVSTKQESIMTYNEDNNYGVSKDILNKLMNVNTQMVMDEEVIAYDKWFLNRPVTTIRNGEIINLQVIKEAKRLIGNAKMEAKMENDRTIKAVKKVANLTKEAEKATKRVLRKEQKMEKAQLVSIKGGMSDMEYKGQDTIVCREEELTVTVKKGYISVAINKENKMVEEVKVEKVTKQGGFMDNNPEGYGPQRFCNCHNGVTKELLQEAMDSYGVDYADEHPITADMERDLNSSRTQLEPMEDGFVCPVCGEQFNMDGLLFDGHADAMAFVIDSEMPHYSGEESTTIYRCDSLSLVVNEYTDIVALKQDILSACKGDIVRAEDMASFLITETELNSEMADGIGREMISYEEDYMSDDYDDDGETINHSMINAEMAADKLIPWLGETVNILGMLDFEVNNNKFVEDNASKVIPGVFSRYYKTNHTRLAEVIKEKAKLAQTNIISLRDTVIDGDTVISKFDAKYLISELTYEYDYWMSFATDSEWNGYKKHQFSRSVAIDHLSNGGELKYYQYETKTGDVAFGYHPDTYTKDNTDYINHGGAYMLAEDNNEHLKAEVLERMSTLNNIAVSRYMFKGNEFISMVLFDGATRIGAYSGFANDENRSFFKELIKMSNGAVIINNNYSLICDMKSAGAHVVSNLYLLISDLATYWNIEIDPTVTKHVSSNKWLADIKFTGKELESTVEFTPLNDYTEEVKHHNFRPINTPDINIKVEKSIKLVNGEIECSINIKVDNKRKESIASALYGHNNKLWIALKDSSVVSNIKTNDMDDVSANVIVHIGDEFMSPEDIYYEELAEMAAMEDTLHYNK